MAKKVSDIKSTTNCSLLPQNGEFEDVCTIIDKHTARALSCVNAEHIFTCWEIGRYLSDRLKGGKWGDKIVRELSDYIKLHRPNYRGYGRSSLYNMVRFYETYSSLKFVQSVNGQLQELMIMLNLMVKNY